MVSSGWSMGFPRKTLASWRLCVRLKFLANRAVRRMRLRRIADLSVRIREPWITQRCEDAKMTENEIGKVVGVVLQRCKDGTPTELERNSWCGCRESGQPGRRSGCAFNGIG